MTVKPKSEQWFIYALSDPDTQSVRYVGASRDPSRRLREHIAAAKKAAPKYPVHGWIARLLAAGRVPKLCILQAVAVDEAWEAAETKWIASVAAQELTNQAPGGHVPYVSPAARARAREKLKQRVFTDEHRARISAAKTGVPRTDAAAVAERLRVVAKQNRGKTMHLSAEERARRRSAALELAAGNSARWANLTSDERDRRAAMAREQMKRVWAERKRQRE